MGGLAKKGDAACRATACIAKENCCKDGSHTKPDENVRASTDKDGNLIGICTPGFAVCESCDYKHTKTALSVFEMSQEELLSRSRRRLRLVILLRPLLARIRVSVVLLRVFPFVRVRLLLRALLLLRRLRVLCRIISRAVLRIRRR